MSWPRLLSLGPARMPLVCSRGPVDKDGLAQIEGLCHAGSRNLPTKEPESRSATEDQAVGNAACGAPTLPLPLVVRKTRPRMRMKVSRGPAARKPKPVGED